MHTCEKQLSDFQVSHTQDHGNRTVPIASFFFLLPSLVASITYTVEYVPPNNVVSSFYEVILGCLAPFLKKMITLVLEEGMILQL